MGGIIEGAQEKKKDTGRDERTVLPNLDAAASLSKTKKGTYTLILAKCRGKEEKRRRKSQPGKNEKDNNRTGGKGREETAIKLVKGCNNKTSRISSYIQNPRC